MPTENLNIRPHNPARITLSRRNFIKSLGAAGAITAAGGVSLLTGPTMTAWALPGAGEDTVLVTVFLAGGADGLDLIAPYTDSYYQQVRPSIAVTAGAATDLDGTFGLHPALAPLGRHFAAGRLAAVHLCGNPLADRSHFEAIPLMDAAMGSGGWLQRALARGGSASPGFDQFAAGVSVGPLVDPALSGAYAGSVVGSIGQINRAGDDLSEFRPALEALYAAASPIYQTAMSGALESIDSVATVGTPTVGIYPEGGLANDLRQAAALIKGDIGVRGIAIRQGGWDHHSRQSELLRTFATELGASLDTFHTDLGESAKRVVVVVMSEFGRTVAQNGAGGTDHGRGNAMLVLGDPLVGAGGGRVHVNGGWPGLNAAVDTSGRFLEISTDYRSVLSEIVDRHLGVTDTAAVFPNFSPTYVDLLSATAPQLGDVNGDGVVDDDDVRAILAADVGNPPSGYNAARGDLNGDGVTDLADAKLLLRAIRNG